MSARPEFLRRLLLLAAVCPLCALPLPAEAPGPPKAALRVSGLGWVRDRDQRLSLERLLGDQRGATLDANAIEDAAFLLRSALAAEGFLRPVIEIEVQQAQGPVRRFTFDPTLGALLPRPLEAKAVSLVVREGVRSVVTAVNISGLTAVPMDLARERFMPGRALFGQAAVRAYTPGRLRRALEGLREDLRQRGYAEAEVTARAVTTDEATGRTPLSIVVVEGPRWVVNRVHLAGDATKGTKLDFLPEFEHRPWSPLWQQDVRERVRRALYARGYVDMTVTVSPEPGALSAGVKPVEVTVTISAGPQVRVGKVRFVGNHHTRESILRRRIRAKPGDPLNPITLERARYRLSRLGIFTAVDLKYEPPDGEVRDPVFQLTEARRLEANLLVGYGSYEQLRAGVEFRQLNLFGLAHQSRLELLQSMKSSRGEYTYTVPELFGESVDGAARLFGLQRQELSFLRQEYGATLAVKRPLPWSKIDGMVGYTYQALRNKDSELSPSIVNNTDIRVASLDFGLTSEHRDSPLRPRRGYQWFVRLETASRALGGETDYQRLESGASFHTGWGQTRWVHLGVTYGLITTAGADGDRLLPVNKRFFPGGDSSIRGYQSGEAAPRGPDGLFIGAKSYVLANLELEQALTPNWSVLVFGDGLGETARLSAGVLDERLYSIGAGVRYQTLIGPVRLEYGRNLNPRPGDPGGTLHVSVGFPF